MKKISLLFIFIAGLSISAFAQKTDDAKDATAVIDKLFAEMANHNPAAIVELWTKEAVLTAVIKRKDGTTAFHSMNAEAFSKNFSEKKNVIREDMYEMKTHVDDKIAMVWGRYVFFVDGKVSHCGLNTFDLVKTDSGWKIANASSSIDPTACTEKEKKRKM